jgi:hypothetical protein
VAKGSPTIPSVSRFWDDSRFQGQGLSRALLFDALMRTAQAAETIGIRALLVHAMDEPAKRFHLHFNFETTPVDPMHLMLFMKDLRALIR